MAIDKNRRGGYAYNRPFYQVDDNASINAGMIAFLATSGGAVVATTAPSGTVPIGTFWKDHNTTWQRTTIESRTFGTAAPVNNLINLRHSPLVSAATIRVTNAAGTVVFTQGTDYTNAVANGVLTRLATGTIVAGATVLIWYSYNIPANQINQAGPFEQGGTNYDRQANDTVGSGKITVVEGFAHIYTDQFDPAQAYVMNANLRSDALSRWTTAVTAWPVCGRVISLPTAAYPYLGVRQIPVP